MTAQDTIDTPLGPARLESPGGLDLRRLPIHLSSDDSRVINLPFMPGGESRVRTLFERLGKLDEAEVEEALDEACQNYSHRHRDLLASFEENFATGSALAGLNPNWSARRCYLAGAYLTMEYAIESAALFNPSIVSHPDQSGMGEGSVRYLMSLRATGEGHVSSIVFRTGTIAQDGQVTIDDPSNLLSRAKISTDRRYLSDLFTRKLKEMGINGLVTEDVMARVGPTFTMTQLTEAVRQVRASMEDIPSAQGVLEMMLWLANSNYHIELGHDAKLSELVIYPMSDLEARGVEDLRLVRFVDDDGTVEYFGTYTAFNGVRVLPMLIQSRYFRRIEVHSLNGRCATNKGMALFPRRIGGHYVMCSRIDGENLYIAYSDYTHFWESAELLVTPRASWELMQMGNCGSPIETPEGWLLLTHGVGPMRNYCISALLLDRDDPMRVIGHLRQPLIRAMGPEREGYVPNVVYTCGAMAHNGYLYLPFSLADHTTTMAVVGMDQLLNRLMDGGPP